MFTRGREVDANAAAFVHPTALLYGRVHLGEGASVFPYVVMRSEAYEIRIGARTNIQDFVMIHVGNGSPTIVGEHSLVRPGQVFPPNSVIAGAPARLIKERDCSEDNLRNARMYELIAHGYKEGRDRL